MNMCTKVNVQYNISCNNDCYLIPCAEILDEWPVFLQHAAWNGTLGGTQDRLEDEQHITQRRVLVAVDVDEGQGVVAEVCDATQLYVVLILNQLVPGWINMDHGWINTDHGWINTDHGWINMDHG